MLSAFRRPWGLGAVLVTVLVTGAALVACGRGRGAEPPIPSPVRAVDPAVVQTTSGAVRGRLAADYRLFAGIPYAAPPVGSLRWQPPTPAAAWQGVRDATEPGPWCVQESEGGRDRGRPVSEDCLTLNVWTPNHGGAAGEQLRPVLVWIHGGGFINGSGDIYNAGWLTTRGDIVVVTINYRLGTLGFLADPALAGDGEAGNYGLADQQAALRWVRDNIANFGGDPGKVTIAGESAGAMSVCDHLVTPGSAGLFRAAIIQSGPCQAQADRHTAQRISIDYAASVGCRDRATAAACLRALPVAKLEKPPWYFHLGTIDALTGPITGTEALPVDPVAAIAAGKAARVPVLIGTNHDEFTLFTGLHYLRAGKLPPYRQLLSDTFGARASLIAEQYPPQAYGDSVALAYSAAATDGLFACPTDRIAAGLTGNAPVYGYEFNDPHAPTPEPLRHLPFPVGASHALELRYLFDVGGAPRLDRAQQQLSDQMIDYWSQFVTTGVPGVYGLPGWPVMGADGGDNTANAPRLSLETGRLRMITDFDAAHRCRFWASLNGQR